MSATLDAYGAKTDDQHREVLDILKYQVQSSENNRALIQEIIDIMQKSVSILSKSLHPSLTFKRILHALVLLKHYMTINCIFTITFLF